MSELTSQISKDIARELDREIFGITMYGLTEKTVQAFDRFCRSNEWMMPSGIRVGILSGEAKRDGKWIFPYENAIELAHFRWSEKTKNRRRELYPENRRGFMADGVEFSDVGYLLVRSVHSDDNLKEHTRSMELVLRAFVAGAGARVDGFSKKSKW